ncbi:MAG: DUF1273 family protein [Clostridia bacterium]|nr:DUF1273 family protein [Clostridia bacterium]
MEKIDDAVYAAVLKAAEQGCDIFYTGAMGEFDSLFSSAVRKVKKTYPKIKLICVKPYFTIDLNINGEYYSALYDDVIIPDELADIHPKAAIKYRNRWMIDHSNIILIFTKRSYGGAYEARRYAERIGKKIVYI